MKLPIRLLVTDITDLPSGITWGEVILNWEAYMQEWQESTILPSSVTEVPILDMFDGESITVKDVIKDLKDPSKLFTEFSKTFTLPASRKNNLIFKHYYNLDIDNGFDARALVNCKILMNNEVYKVGNLSLESVKMANGSPISYTVRFYGKLSELSKKLGEDKLHDLPLATLTNFNAYTKFNSATIQNIVFPLSSRENRFKWNSSKTAYDAVEKTKTIQYIDSTRNPTNYGVEPSDLVGAMKVGYIISLIEAEYGLSFTGAIKQEYIDKLYLWLSNYKDDDGTAMFDAFATNLTPTTTGFTGVFVSSSDHNFAFLGGTTYNVRLKGNSWTGNGKATIYVDGAPVSSTTTSGGWTSYTVTGTPTFVEYQIETDSAQTVNITVEIKNNTGGATETFTASVVVNSTTDYKPKEYVPKMTINEFLSSIFKMFNIVAVVQDNLTINTYHYDAFMASGSVKDVGEYIDVSNAEVMPPNFFSSIQFSHKNSKTAIEEGYLVTSGRDYGSLSYETTDAIGNRLSGDSYEVSSGVSIIPTEQITDTVLHTYFGDTSLNKVKVESAFTYVMPNNLTVSFDTGTTVGAASQYLMPINTFDPLFNITTTSHLNGLYFGSELYTYNPSTNIVGLGLYNCFYRGLVGHLLDNDKRIVKMRAMFTQGFLKDLKLSDVLTVRGNFYNISSIETNFDSGISNLELIQIGSVKNPNMSIRTASTTNSTGSTVYISYINSSGYLTHSSISNTGSINVSMIGNVIRDTGGLLWSYS